jgi:hypothetical protein
MAPEIEAPGSGTWAENVRSHNNHGDSAVHPITFAYSSSSVQARDGGGYLEIEKVEAGDVYPLLHSMTALLRY